MEIDLRKEAILKAALDAFANYGFRRTSMEDIAQRANVSRAALYIHFKNKKDVFRSLSKDLHERASAKVREVLKEETALEETIFRALESKEIEMFEIVYSSPHGQELIDINFGIGTDISEAAQEDFINQITDWLEQMDREESINLLEMEASALSIAELILHASQGLKNAVSGVKEYRTRLRLMARMIALSLKNTNSE